MSKDEPLLRTEDVAKRLNVDAKTVQRWARDGKLPAVRIGGTVRFERDAVEEAISAASPPASPPEAITNHVRLEGE